MCKYSAKHLFSSVLHPQQILQPSSSANALMLDYTLLGFGSQVSSSKTLNRFPNMGEFSEIKTVIIMSTNKKN